MLDYYSELKIHLEFFFLVIHHFYSQAKQLFITCFIFMFYPVFILTFLYKRMGLIEKH